MSSKKEYDLFQIAYFIINESVDKGYPVNCIKLLILMYLTQVEFIRNFDRKCFKEEITLWVFGPFIKNIAIFKSLWFLDPITEHQGVGENWKLINILDYNFTPVKYNSKAISIAHANLVSSLIGSHLTKTGFEMFVEIREDNFKENLEMIENFK